MRLKTCLLLLCLALTGTAFAADEKKAATTPADADADFAYQGEYTGEILINGSANRVGVQIIALGDGKFHLVAYHGGLPGDGWDDNERHELDGELKNGAARFEGDTMDGTVKDGTLTVTSKDGAKLGELKKVERKSPTLGKKPPEGAVVLFDGTTADKFEGGRTSDDGLLLPGCTSKQKFQSFTLHLEFMLPYMPDARGQARGNSGAYMQGRYETQILDSFGLEGKNNECGGLYEIRDPDVNLCFPPLSWQTYDVDFTAAQFRDGEKSADARITVRHNGVTIHRDVPIPRTTRAAPNGTETPDPGPLYLQDHGNPVRFRNIWIAERK